MKELGKNELNLASSILKNGGLIAFPTETVFGLGVIYNNKESYERLINVKRRPPEKPFTVMLSNVKDIEKYAYVNDKARKLISNFMPGQFTIILKAKECLPSYVVSKEGNVGIRISSMKLIQELIDLTGEPLLVPSANRSGEPTLTKYEDVKNIFKNEIDAIIKGSCESNVPSTIVMVDNDVKIIRLGEISEAQIKKVLEEK